MDDDVDAVFRALADPTRRAVLDLLRVRPRTTGELAAAMAGLSRFAVMKHLGVLVEAGLVVARKEGRVRWNHLNAVPLRGVYERWVSRYEGAWAGALLSLRRHAEEREPVSAPQTRVFIVRQEIVIAAPRERVFAALTEETAAWFWRGPGGNHPPSIIEPRVGGRFYQDHGGGRGNLYAFVGAIRPPEVIRLIGDMDTGRAAHSIINIRLAAEGRDRTRISVEHRGAGEADDAYVNEFDAGWKEELEALKGYVERQPEDLWTPSVP